MITLIVTLIVTIIVTLNYHCRHKIVQKAWTLNNAEFWVS